LSLLRSQFLKQCWCNMQPHSPSHSVQLSLISLCSLHQNVRNRMRFETRWKVECEAFRAMCRIRKRSTEELQEYPGLNPICSSHSTHSSDTVLPHTGHLSFILLSLSLCLSPAVLPPPAAAPPDQHFPDILMVPVSGFTRTMRPSASNASTFSKYAFHEVSDASIKRQCEHMMTATYRLREGKPTL
jgi:hypothetical protein